MKKILSIALVAALVLTSAFAGFTGSANVSLGYDFATKAYGFGNGKSLSTDIELAAETAEAIGEGDIYAGIKATMTLGVKPSESGAAVSIYDTTKGEGFGIWMSLKEAYVAGNSWKLSITGTQGAPDFAKSAIDTKKADVKDDFGFVYDDKDVAVSYSVAANKVPGVTLEIADWKASFGFKGNADKNAKAEVAEIKNPINPNEKVAIALGGPWMDYNAFVQTPSFDFNGLTVQGAFIASSNHSLKGLTVTDTGRPDKVPAYSTAIGVSGKVGYSNETVSASFAADYGVKMLKGDYKVYGGAISVNGTVEYFDEALDITVDKSFHGLDLAANFAIDPVTVDVYYKNEDLSNAARKADEEIKKNSLLSAQVKTDLKSFDVPVALTVAGKDMINTQALSASATCTFDAFEVTAKVGYTIYSKKFSTGASVKYTADMFTAKAGADISTIFGTDDSCVLTMNASVETEAIIPGAKLSLAYGKGANDMNLLDKQTGSDVKAQNLGKITAKCAIEF